MTPTATTELVRDWTHDRTTPDLVGALQPAETDFIGLDSIPDLSSVDEEGRAQLVDDLIAWATDPTSFEEGAADRIRKEAWGDAGA